MSPVTGLARLAGRSLPSVHMGNFSPVTVHMGNFSSVTEMNKARPFKFHPGNRDLFGRKNRDLGIRASRPSHMNTSKFSQISLHSLACST